MSEQAEQETLEQLAQFVDLSATKEDIWAAVNLQASINSSAALLTLLRQHKITLRQIPESDDIEDAKFYKVIE